MTRQRVVLDTDVLISMLLCKESTAGRAAAKAMTKGLALVSDETLADVEEKLSQPKFDAFVTADQRRDFIALVRKVAEHVDNIEPLIAAREAKNDKFLSLAVTGGADLVVSDAQDLVSMNGFRGVRIITPAAYVNDGEQPKPAPRPKFQPRPPGF